MRKIEEQLYNIWDSSSDVVSIFNSDYHFVQRGITVGAI